MRTAVTGATGVVGVHIVEHLLEQGHTVQALCREPSRQSIAPAHPNLLWFKGDLNDIEALERLVDGCDGLVHAAFSHKRGRYRGGEGENAADFIEVNLHQTKRLLTLAQSSSVQNTVFLSSRAVFDAVDTAGESIEDDCLTNPNSLYGQVKVDAEKFGLSCDGIGFRTLRATGVYASERVGLPSKWRGLAESVIQESVDWDRLSNQSRTEVHALDLASAVEILLKLPTDEGSQREFNCSDIAISERQLAHLLLQCQFGTDSLAEYLPEAIPAPNVMHCEGLRRLGWVPRGLLGLVDTIKELVAALCCRK